MAKKDKWKNIPIDREEEEFQRRVRARHIELFPEEYDHMFDSFSDARERKKGRSPMNPDHLAGANASRIAMGFEPLSESGYATSRDTFRFVEERMRAGKDVTREDLISANPKAEAKVDQRREIAPKGSDAGSMLDQRIDRMLAGEAFIYEGQDRSDPRVIAFRVLGELFELNRSGDNEPEMLSQIRRLLPTRSESEYQNLYRHAMNEWMEAYGF
jgi:hypothetical protein